MAADPKSDRKSVSVEMVKSSKVDPSRKTNDANLPPKDGVMSDAVSCVSSVDAVGSIKESDLDQESLMSEQTMYYPAGSYYGYYYPGFDNTYMEWSDSNYAVQPSGLEAQQSLVQSDGGQVMYFAPGFQPGYTPYGAYVPGTMVGFDGNYMCQQPYLLSPVVPQTPGSPAYITSPIGYGPEMVPAYSWDSSFWDGYGVSGFDGTPSMPSQKPKSFQKTQHSKNNNQNSKLNVMVALSVDVPNQPLKPVNKSPNLSKGYYPAIKPSYAPQGSPGILYRSTPANVKEASRNWYDADKTKAQNKTNNAANLDLLTEQNRGPRIDNLKTSWISAADQTGAPVGTDDICGNKTVVIRRDDYNLPDFPLNYEHAMFFVIKSYSEDDIHKSIKYNVWASTPNGNKRLDNAFQVAQDKMSEKGSKCPIFLFFSVNASGQFCGVAEMTGPVNFNKNMDFWQQDKWNGFFSVRWHMIKDVPNPHFRHIILENNDHKPVTNSRDTQEVKFSQGIEMLSIFKNFSSRTSILDDFGFYENRQKVMLEKRGRFSVPTVEQFLPKADEAVQAGKPKDAAPPVSSLDTLELDLKALDLHAKSDEQPVAVAID